MSLIPFAGGGTAAGVAPHFYGDLIALGLDSTCWLCLDAGHGDSYTSGNSWLDLSGNGYDFMLGSETGSPSTGDEPTFNGTPGGLSSSEYWSFDGGDFFTYDTTSESVMDDMHQDNADWTWLFWVNLGTVADEHTLWGSGGPSNTGCSIRTFSGGTTRMNVYNGGSTALEITSTGAVTDSAWTMVGMSIDEAGGSSASFHYMNSTVDAATATYSSPSAGAAAGPLLIGSRYGGGSPSEALNGDKIAGVMFFSSSLTEANVDAIFDRQKVRYGL